MIDPISANPASPTTPTAPSTPARPGALSGPAPLTGDFADELRQQLAQVNQMQAEADAGIQQLLTGQTDNITQVLTSARKAEIAFSLLMEIRNKLVDAYTELKQLRV